MIDPDHPIRIIVAYDQALIRSGLSAFLLLFDELKLVGEAQDAEETLQLCELTEPNVVLMDLGLPGEDSLSVTRTIKLRWPQTKVLLLGDSKNPETMSSAQEAGASGYLTKDLCAGDLAQAIHQLYQEESEAYQESSPDVPQREMIEVISAEPDAVERPDLQEEMAAAGRIQANLLPEEAPNLRGWDIAACLEPARSTSGDFFDFIPLANGDWGIVVADVSDKGMGAALFMTLCSTLIRTYAMQYPLLPAITMGTVNDRILSDSRGGMFVTAFYGVLEPDSGRLRYVNAGHNPPMLFSCKKGRPIDSLRPTGMVLGVMENAHWGQKVARMQPGDLLVLYTDGITEAQDKQGRFFGQERLVQIARAQQGRPAVEIQAALLSEVHHFCDSEALQDDLALIVIARK
ncbi:MAG: SpoIIE family protein phosphatase [Anaerolineales bacterium]|nr:SpoIIE family protein phosphatase [Anaerolineales bacterium]